MQISRSIRYKNSLFKILAYIAQDKIGASENFKNELDDLIDGLPNSPYKYRKSKYFDDKNIRDMIYKGYTIVYKINIEKNKIDIVRVFNRNQPLVFEQ